MDIKLSERFNDTAISVVNRLPQAVRKDLEAFVTTIREESDYLLNNKPCRYVYGSYSEGGNNICIYKKDCASLSDKAISGVIAHELGHAYCHFKNGMPCLPNTEIDYEANRLAVSWGFKDNLECFERERNPPKGL